MLLNDNFRVHAPALGLRPNRGTDTSRKLSMFRFDWRVEISNGFGSMYATDGIHPKIAAKLSTEWGPLSNRLCRPVGKLGRQCAPGICR